MRGGETALPKLLWFFLVIYTLDKAHRVVIIAIAQLSCRYMFLFILKK